MCILDDNSNTRLQAIGADKKERRSLKKALKKLGNRSRAEEEESDFSKQSDDEPDAEAIAKLGLPVGRRSLRGRG